MDTIAELFRRNILGKPHSDEELMEVVKELRERRRQLMLEKEEKAKERTQGRRGGCRAGRPQTRSAAA